MNIPRDLVKDIVRGNCVVFVGAGLSTGAGLPKWPRLLHWMLDWSLENSFEFSREEQEEIRKHIERNELLLVAQELMDRLGPQRFADFMSHVFRRSKPQPTAVHACLTRVPFSAALTSNYDSLLEMAYRVGMPDLATYTHTNMHGVRQAHRNREFYLFKVHGDILDSSTLVLGHRGYRELVHANSKYRLFMESLLADKTLLFIAFGLTDPDLLLLIDELRTSLRGDSGYHYALMNSEEVSSVRRRRLREDYGIQVITYTPGGPDHPEVREFLERLAEEVALMKSEKAQKEVERSKKVTDDPRYVFSLASAAELEELHEFCKQFFGTDFSSLELMRAWRDKNPEIFWLLRERAPEGEGAPGRLVGYYSLIPLTERAAALVQSEQITGASLTADCVVARGEKPAAYYIGGIAALPEKPQGYVVASLIQRLDKERRAGMPIYSRPVTRDGLRLIQKYGFTPVSLNYSGLNRIHRAADLL